MDLGAIESSVEQILKAIGEDPERQGLVKTPHRVANSYEELLAGYRMDPKELINQAVFDVAYDEMVIVRDIEFSSLCEHHMLPFIGRVHVAYIPSDKVIGLSKIPRIVDLFSKRLQLQERMTTQIADFINLVLNPQGVAVVAEGLHMCMMLRGVKKQDARMTTSAMLGAFRDSISTRMEFLDNISRGASNLHI
ncbi:MAG: GTP cyclohydrolase I FolE [Chloroflexota bacterium]|nr:GTP cyclohydrolase I FolE [Chloroflexota bacterium]